MITQHETLLLIVQAILSGLAAAVFVRRGPKGVQGDAGMPGPPGAMGPEGRCHCKADPEVHGHAKSCNCNQTDCDKNHYL